MPVTIRKLEVSSGCKSAKHRTSLRLLKDDAVPVLPGCTRCSRVGLRSIPGQTHVRSRHTRKQKMSRLLTREQGFAKWKRCAKDTDTYLYLWKIQISICIFIIYGHRLVVINKVSELRGARLRLRIARHRHAMRSQSLSLAEVWVMFFLVCFNKSGCFRLQLSILLHEMNVLPRSRWWIHLSLPPNLGTTSGTWSADFQLQKIDWLGGSSTREMSLINKIKVGQPSVQWFTYSFQN